MISIKGKVRVRKLKQVIKINTYVFQFSDGTIDDSIPPEYDIEVTDGYTDPKKGPVRYYRKNIKLDKVLSKVGLDD